jgi:membrane protease subunit HflK
VDRRQGAALVSAGVNVVLVVVKVALATVSGSIALLADAWHSLSDVFVSLFVFAGFRFSDASRRRVALVENVIALLIGVAILIAGLSILRKAFVASMGEVSNLGIAMVGTFLTIAVAYFLARYKLHVGGATSSPALIADGAHSHMDVYSSCAVLVGLLGQMIGLQLDKAAAVVVVFFIAKAGFGVIGDAARALAAGEMLDTTKRFDVRNTRMGSLLERLSGAVEHVVGRRPRLGVRGLIAQVRAAHVFVVSVMGAGFVAAYLLSGLYTVGPDQRAVVLRLGRVVAVDVAPGLHWSWPRPIDRVIHYTKDFMRRVEIGFRLRMIQETLPTGDAFLWESRHMGGFYEKRPEEALMVTGDENIIDLNLVVHYQISDPAAYLFRMSAPDTLVRAAAEAVARRAASEEPLEAMLTTDRNRIEHAVQAALQGLLDSYGAGIRVVSVRLQDVHPPVDVVSAFREVSSAREDKSRLVREAEAYAADALPRARGEAQKTLQEAAQALVQNTNRATGEAGRFDAIVTEYSKARNVTQRRLYLQTVEQALSGARKLVVDASLPPGSVDLRLLPPGAKEEPMPDYDQMEMERQLDQLGVGRFPAPDFQQSP